MSVRATHKGPHKYIRTKFAKTGTVVWRCGIVGCRHYLADELIENRLSKCHKCDSTFTMNKDKMRRKKPKCDKCQHKGDPVFASLDALLEDL